MLGFELGTPKPPWILETMMHGGTRHPVLLEIWSEQDRPSCDLSALLRPYIPHISLYHTLQAFILSFVHNNKNFLQHGL